MKDRLPTGWGPEDRSKQREVPGGVTAARGFVAEGAHVGLKSSRPDLALVATDGPTSAAAVTTGNLVKAPACVLTERHVADGRCRALVANAGNANVCTPQGTEHAHQMAAATAEALDIDTSDVLVMSTGVIGVPLPIDAVTAGIPPLAARLSRDGGGRAARAIMTTDSVPKEFAVRITDDQGSCVIGGMAKGVGMVEPSMATVLVLLTTDAPVGATILARLLHQSVDRTFNRISVDGEQSTSDTVAALATGQVSDPPGLAAFTAGLHGVCAELAYQIVADGEGATRVAAVTVRSAPTEQLAERLARAVATSPLVRAALHGADPNWGRIMATMGASGVAFEPERVGITIGGVPVCRNGVAAGFDRSRAVEAMEADTVDITVDVGLGQAASTLLTCDLTPEYVHLNSAYTT